jgi:hypothetical protein
MGVTVTWLRSQLRVTPVAMTVAGRSEIQRLGIIAGLLFTWWIDGWFLQAFYAVLALVALRRLAHRDEDSS